MSRWHKMMVGGLQLALLSGIALAAPGAVAADDIHLSGTVRWTDSVGRLHAAARAPVQIWDAELGAAGRLGEAYTDDDGRWSLAVDAPADGASRRLYARAECRWEHGYVKAPQTLVHAIRSSDDVELAAGATASFDLIAGNELDNETCFSVREALAHVSEYYADLQGGEPEFLRVIYPTDARTSMFLDGRLHILRLDRWDWDVVLHEFGHHVADQHGIDRSPGGDHSTDENLSEIKDQWGNILGKDIGIRLAWSEGFATYFSISAQRAMHLDRLGIPFVGDAWYSDTEDLNFEYSLKPADGSLGEDNELTVSRFLFDLFDGVTGWEGDAVALGDRGVWEMLTTAHPTTLSEAITALLQGQPAAEQVKIGALAGRHGVAPTLLPPAIDGEVPTFRWAANGGGPDFPNNRFVVHFYDAAMQQVLETKEIAATAFTPTADEWATLKATAGPVHWVVTGRSVAAPVTGPYVSAAGQIAW